MPDIRFDILFAGEILAGADRAAVAENLARLFKATPETVERLMGGGTHVLKRGTDRDTALKYESAMERAGARAILRELPATATTAASSTATAIATATATATTADPAPAPSVAPGRANTEPAFSLAPRGADVLAPHERRAVEPVVVDTSGISLASVFSAPAGELRPPPPPAPDTSHISISAPGAALLEGHQAPAPPPPPDTTGFSLAAPGERLAPEAERPPVALPDLEGITLAPPGTPLEEIRPDRAAVNPDTSALSLLPAGP